MADQAINALSTKTAPETSDQLLLVGTGEPQLIDYDKLADAILNKITSKNYALDAGQMTLLAALNKLNSDKLRIINNGSVQPNSIIFVSFQDQTINSKFFVVPINTNIAEGHINISLINSQNRVFIGVFSYEINNGTLTANKGLVYNAYDHSTTEYNAPVIAEIMCINK